MRRICLGLTIAAAGLAGCVSVEPAGMPMQASSRDVIDSNYTLGRTLSATVGDTLVRSKAYREVTTGRTAYRANQTFAVDGGIVHAVVQANQELPVVGARTVNGVRYDLAAFGDARALMIGPDGSPANKVMNGLGTSTPVEMFYTFRFTPADVKLSPVESRHSEKIAGRENFELLFNGIDGQGIRLQYREYTADDMARPAFSQDLSYPLTSKVIRFRKLVLEVDQVSDQGMTYRVVSDGSQP
jgi:hypothetical protein